MNKVGFIGLGIMGKPMATNLIKGGVDLMVNDLNSAAVEELVKIGAKKATLEEIGSQCNIIFTILPNGEIVKDVIFGETGLQLSLKKESGFRQLVCDMSSVMPTESKYCFERLEKLNIGFVDAPVSGGEPKAIDGTLAFMAGGMQDDFENLMPYFDIMGSSAVLVGDSGCGSVTKLANQVIVNMNIATVSEALVLAKKAGAEPQKVYEAIRGGLAGSAVLDAKAPMMIERNFKPGGTIAINKKDIKNVIDTAEKLTLPMPLSSQLFQIMQWMDVHGYIKDDHAGIVKYFEDITGVIVE